MNKIKTGKDVPLFKERPFTYDEFKKKESFYICIDNYVYQRLIGKLMEVIECLGLPERQEEAFKTQIKEQIYTVKNDLSFNLTREQIEKGYLIPKL